MTGGIEIVLCGGLHLNIHVIFKLPYDIKLKLARRHN